MGAQRFIFTSPCYSDGVCRAPPSMSRHPVKVILSGVDLYELERVQRLCILAWMKAVDWELFTVSAEGDEASATHVSLPAESQHWGAISLLVCSYDCDFLPLGCAT